MGYSLSLSSQHRCQTFAALSLLYCHHHHCFRIVILIESLHRCPAVISSSLLYCIILSWLLWIHQFSTAGGSSPIADYCRYMAVVWSPYCHHIVIVWLSYCCRIIVISSSLYGHHIIAECCCCMDISRIRRMRTPTIIIAMPLLSINNAFFHPLLILQVYKSAGRTPAKGNTLRNT